MIYRAATREKTLNRAGTLDYFSAEAVPKGVASCAKISPSLGWGSAPPRTAHGRLFVWRRAGLGGPIGLTPATGDAKSAAMPTRLRPIPVNPWCRRKPTNVRAAFKQRLTYLLAADPPWSSQSDGSRRPNMSLPDALTDKVEPRRSSRHRPAGRARPARHRGRSAIAPKAT